MVMVKCSALVRSHLIYLVVGSFGPVPSVGCGKKEVMRPVGLSRDALAAALGLLGA